MRPHDGGLVAHELAVPARLERVLLVPGQRGDDVEPVAQLRPARRRCWSSPRRSGPRRGRSGGRARRCSPGPSLPWPSGRPARGAGGATPVDRGQRLGRGLPREAGGAGLAPGRRGRARWSGRRAARPWRRPRPSTSSGSTSTPPSPTTSGSAVDRRRHHRARRGSWPRGRGCRSLRSATGTSVPWPRRTARRGRPSGRDRSARTRSPRPRRSISRRTVGLGAGRRRR